jgi:tripeptidyl-peptidase I
LVGEADLDVQYTGAISFPIPNTYISTGGRPTSFIPDALTGDENSNEPYAEFLAYLSSLKKPPQVISTSYDDDEQT